MVVDGLIPIMQAAPLRCQEIRDHKGLAIAFGLWCWPAVVLSPQDLAAVVLEECGLVVGDENESEWPTIRQWESIWAWEFTSVVVPVVETLIVGHPPLKKRTSIGHDVLPLIAINVHPIPGTFVSPVQLLQPAGGGCLRNRRLANAFL